MAHKKKIDTGEFSLQGLGFNMLAGGAIFGCTDPLAFNYDATANSDDGSCCLISGCTDPAACNYDSANPACHDDGSCESTSCAGCTDPTATNHDPLATIDDGSCNYTPIILGCTDPNASNYDSTATVDDGSCIPCIYGCTDNTFVEYNSSATCDDGSCLTACTYGCMDDDYVEYDAAATCDDGSCVTLCIDGCTDSAFVEYWFDTNGNPITPPATCDDGSCATNCVFGCMDNSFVEYDPNATCPDNTCITPCVVGCMDPLYIGYNAFATCDDPAMCGAVAVLGCTDIIACNYDPAANIDDSSCTYGDGLNGSGGSCCLCTAPNADTSVPGCCSFTGTLNYNPTSTCNDGSCIMIVYGCTDSTALNYYSGANTDDGTCAFIAGCTDDGFCVDTQFAADTANINCACSDYHACGYFSPSSGYSALNYNPSADYEDGSCIYDCASFPTTGCTDPTACNYNCNPAAVEDGSCEWSSCNTNNYQCGVCPTPSCILDQGQGYEMHTWKNCNDGTEIVFGSWRSAWTIPNAALTLWSGNKGEHNFVGGHSNCQSSQKHQDWLEAQFGTIDLGDTLKFDFSLGGGTTNTAGSSLRHKGPPSSSTNIGWQNNYLGINASDITAQWPSTECWQYIGVKEINYGAINGNPSAPDHIIYLQKEELAWEFTGTNSVGQSFQHPATGQTLVKYQNNLPNLPCDVC